MTTSSLETAPLQGEAWASVDPEIAKGRLTERLRTSRTAVGWSCSAALFTALVTNLIWLIATRRVDDPQVNCLYALGGGPTPNGGSFPQPKVQQAPCPSIIKSYLRGQYDLDVDEAISAAWHFFESQQAPGDKKEVVVLDIDETALSNRAEFMQQLTVGYDAERNRAWELSATAPPLKPTLALYLDLLKRGYMATFITGRSEGGGMREATAANLQAAGYGRPCSASSQALMDSSPCYLKLDMREDGDSRLASIYKPDRRRLLQDDGYEIVAAFGDQWSDLAGLAPATASFKLPNPMYYIL